MKTIRDFMNLVEQDIDPSTVVLDPAPAPAPAAGEVITKDGKKYATLSPEQIAKIREILKKADVVLKKYTDPETKKPFESVDVDSMTESEQHQYIMQNLHLLSEADQMVILRSITTENKVKMAGDIIKYGIDKTGNAIKYGIEKIATPLVGGIWSGFAGPVLKWVTLGALGLGVIKNWKYIFNITPEAVNGLTKQDWEYMAALQNEYLAVCKLPPGIDDWAWPSDLGAEMLALNKRWDRFNEVLAGNKAAADSSQTTSPPGKTEPGMLDQVGDYIKDTGDYIKGLTK